MATIIPFPINNNQQQPSLKHCAGCSSVIKGDYWEVGLPQGSKKEYLALCEDCNQDMLDHGVIL